TPDEQVFGYQSAASGVNESCFEGGALGVWVLHLGYALPRRRLEASGYRDEALRAARWSRLGFSSPRLEPRVETRRPSAMPSQITIDLRRVPGCAQATTASLRRAAISPSLYPAASSTSVVCSPSCGGWRRSDDGLCGRRTGLRR